MLAFPNIDPVALDLGVVQIRWYGICYLLGFAACWLLGNYRAKKADSGWESREVEDLIFYGAVGVVLGGRVGYTLFYGFAGFLNDPLSIIRIWEGGMSFHGGLLGVVAAYFYFAKKTGRTFFQVADFLAPMIPIGLGLVRFANWINGELWGRAASSDVPWAMVFPRDRLQLARHPSQLYEVLTEGVVLFLLLWWFSSKPRPRGAITGLFGLGYGVARFSVEFFREPDAHMGFIALGWMTMGQLLSAPMIILGFIFIVMAYRKEPLPGQ